MNDALKFLDKCLIVSLKDGRTVFGIFQSIDKERNIILNDATIQIPKEFVSPLNQYLSK